MNLTEKILAKAANKKEVSPGEIIKVNVDLAMTHDGTTPPTIKSFKKISNKVWDPDRIVIVYDHNVPPNNIGAAEFQKVTQNFVKEQGIKNFYNHGEGICHQVLPEKGFVFPGMVIIGADSHTCTYGAFGAFSTGVGATDMAVIFATGKTWLLVPESYLIEINGSLNKYVTAKDVILKIIGKIKAKGAVYKSIEFKGETIYKMNVSGRMTMCNMVVEMGAKNGIMVPNKKTIKYLRKFKKSFRIYKPDKDAEYEKEFYFDVSNMGPQVACPHNVDNVKPVYKVEGKHIDQAFLGSCTNGRIEDLRIAAEILKDGKIHEDVRMIVVPASKDVYMKAVKEGIIETFIKAGAIVCNPGCGPCLGAHMGVLGPKEVCISTSNRNFKGRMGDPTSKIYLANPAVVAKSAMEGVITSPE